MVLVSIRAHTRLTFMYVLIDGTYDFDCSIAFFQAMLPTYVHTYIRKLYLFFIHRTLDLTVSYCWVCKSEYSAKFSDLTIPYVWVE